MQWSESFARMRALELPGAIALGLLASLLAHTAAYGQSHAMGGGYHELLLAAAALALGGSIVAAAAVAWAGAGRLIEGSILAARLRHTLPGLPAIAGAAGLWFTLAEHIEPHHDTLSPLLLIVALVLASWLVRTLARAALLLLATMAVAIRALDDYAPHVVTWAARHIEAPHFESALRVARRFARPPPSAVAGA